MSKESNKQQGEVWCNRGSGRGDLFCSVAHPLPSGYTGPPPSSSLAPLSSAAAARSGPAQVTTNEDGSPAAWPVPRPGRSAAASPPASRAGGTGREVDGMMQMTMDDDGAPPSTSAALAEARRQHEATRGFAARVAAQESDTDADSEAPPLGSGTQGVGEPLMVGAHDRRRRLCDGAGLCSLGQWPPWRRPVSDCPQLAQARLHIDCYIDSLYQRIGLTAEQLFDQLAAGEVAEDPFARDADGMSALVDSVARALDNKRYSPVARAEDLAQPVRIRLLQCVLYLGGDPDHHAMDHFGRGVRLGVGVKLPRTPAVYARKRRWRLEGQGDPSFDLAGERDALGEEWRDNYVSARLHQRAILEQLEDAEDRGLALRLSAEEAAHHFPNLTINSLAGIAKMSDKGEVASVRLVMDGTHGVVVNRAIRQRDQDRCPVAADVRRVQREQSLSGPAVGLALDVREAHRLPRVHPLDWGFQGCRSDLTPDIFVFVVGCFGMSSAAYWWSRLGGALIRAAHLLALPSDELWLLLLADDLKAESTSRRPQRAIVFVVVLLVVLGVPLSWRKAQGGRVIEWIGYEVDLRSLALGITQRRAEWCVGFLSQLARDGRADVGHLRGGLGRLAFVVGALEWERPFLAPFYAFLARQPRHGFRSLPLYVRLTAQYVASRLALRRSYPSAVARVSGVEPFRIDASAEGTAIGVGGWLPVRNSAGDIDCSLSPWFAFRLTEEIAPWAFCKGLPFRTIAALEAVGVLVALVAFRPHLHLNSNQWYSMPGLTDNKGNQYTISRLQTTRFPLCAVLMEIAARSEALRLRLAMDWVPRELNAEADILAGGDFAGFSPALRHEVNWMAMDWMVMDWALEHGVRYHAERKPGSERAGDMGAPSKRRRIPLREAEPWSNKKK